MFLLPSSCLTYACTLMLRSLTCNEIFHILVIKFTSKFSILSSLLPACISSTIKKKTLHKIKFTDNYEVVDDSSDEEHNEDHGKFIK